MNDAENTTPTYHQKIMIAKIRSVIIKMVKANFEKLADWLQTTNIDMELVAKMKKFVPELLSHNLVFEVLDTQENEYSNVISITGAG